MPDLDNRDLRVPIIEEAISVDKVTIQTDAVQVLTSVEEREVLVEDVVMREVLNVQRFPMDRAVDVAPRIREEGNTTIISIIEERAVVEKRLFVIEEVHVTREQSQESVSIPVTLRKTTARVDRPSGNQMIAHGTE